MIRGEDWSLMTSAWIELCSSKANSGCMRDIEDGQEIEQSMIVGRRNCAHDWTLKRENTRLSTRRAWII